MDRTDGRDRETGQSRMTAIQTRVTSIPKVVRLAHVRSIPVYVDDAGGARVGPALFDQPMRWALRPGR